VSIEIGPRVCPEPHMGNNNIESHHNKLKAFHKGAPSYVKDFLDAGIGDK